MLTTRPLKPLITKLSLLECYDVSFDEQVSDVSKDGSTYIFTYKQSKI
jgi:hypothetical protein